MKRRARVLVVEDHPITRLGIEAALSSTSDLVVVGEADTLELAKARVATDAPDVVLLDLRLPDGSTLDWICELARTMPQIAVLVLTGVGTLAEEQRALALGARGVLRKEVALDTVVRALRAVAAGHAVAPDSNGPVSTRSPLSPRELEVLELMAEGRTNPEIARALGLSTGTIRTHVSHILTKLDVGDRTEATAVALRRGLV